MLRNLFVDFNSYFASVEQQVHPELRGKPVAVVPVMADSTCCIAASYEAKHYGIYTGMRVSEAKKACPKLLLIEATHRTYIEYHHRLVAAVDYCLPVKQVLSIDEMVCDLIGKERKREYAEALAAKIKKTIRENVGEYLRCSIGIAPNQFLAKTATDMQKPDGLVIIEQKDIPGCLYKLQLKDFCGIGRRMDIRLRRHGIYTVEKLCNVNKDILKKVWGGIEGERMYAQIRGEVVNRPLTTRSTVGHSHVLSPELRTPEKAYAVLNRLLQKAAMRMRHLGYVAGNLYVKVKYIDKSKWKDIISFSPTQNTIELIQALNYLWEQNPLKNSKPAAVAVTLLKLIPEQNNTFSLFENYKKNKSLYSAIDKLTKNYSYKAAYFSGAHNALNSAPMRIAFTQIPNLELEDEKANRL